MDGWAVVPEAGVSPGNLLGMQIIKSHSTPIRLEAIGGGWGLSVLRPSE